jgi:hypothetical protein
MRAASRAHHRLHNHNAPSKRSRCAPNRRLAALWRASSPAPRRDHAVPWLWHGHEDRDQQSGGRATPPTADRLAYRSARHPVRSRDFARLRAGIRSSWRHRHALAASGRDCDKMATGSSETLESGRQDSTGFAHRLSSAAILRPANRRPSTHVVQRSCGASAVAHRAVSHSPSSRRGPPHTRQRRWGRPTASPRRGAQWADPPDRASSRSRGGGEAPRRPRAAGMGSQRGVRAAAGAHGPEAKGRGCAPLDGYVVGDRVARKTAGSRTGTRGRLAETLGLPRHRSQGQPKRVPRTAQRV